MTEVVDILIKDAVVITMDSERRVYEKGSIAISEDKIAAVGKADEINSKYKGEKVFDARKKIVLPGFINTHNHLFQVLFRSLGDDLTLWEWWPTSVGHYIYQLNKEDMYYASAVGNIELIRSGVTTNLDYQYATLTFHCKAPDDCSVGTIKGMKDVGIRGIVARGCGDVDAFDREEWGLPPKIRETIDEAITRTMALYNKWNDNENDMIKIWIAPGAPFVMSDEGAIKVREFATEKKIPISMHFHETRREVNDWKMQHNMTPVQYYQEKFKFFGPDVLAVHCVWMDEKDIKIFKETGTTVSHNTMSNMYLASGVAPVPEFVKNGITVSLGVDGAASNNNQDFFEMIKGTALLHKVARVDPMAITAKKVLEFATIEGARAVLMEDKIGSLEVGKKADLFIMGTNYVNMAPLNNPISQVVYTGKAHNVETVIINGKIVMEDKVITTVDEQKIIEKANESAARIIEDAGRTEIIKKISYSW